MACRQRCTFDAFVFTFAVDSRKTLIYLILTLNHTYPDYDFSLLRAHHFRKEASVKAIEETVASTLLEVSRVGDFAALHELSS